MFIGILVPLENFFSMSATAIFSRRPLLHGASLAIFIILLSTTVNVTIISNRAIEGVIAVKNCYSYAQPLFCLEEDKNTE
jgi:hypothetical protein